MSTTTESGQRKTTESGIPVSKPPPLSVGALVVGILMILGLLTVVALIVLSFFDAVPEIP